MYVCVTFEYDQDNPSLPISEVVFVGPFSNLDEARKWRDECNNANFENGTAELTLKPRNDRVYSVGIKPKTLYDLISVKISGQH